VANKKLTTTRKPQQTASDRIAFIRSVRLAGLGLDQAHAEVNRAALTDIGLREAEMEGEIKLGHAVLSHEDGNFVVSANFELSQKEKGVELPAISIRAVFSAKFDLLRPAPREAVEAFAGLEARLVFFPYIRQFISDLSYRMSIDTILLPLTSEFENRP
jgi:preprotein translocase subunit SecB